jgi:hypothetical protein
MSQVEKLHLIRFRHSGLDPESSAFSVVRFWMPDPSSRTGMTDRN